jgi:hypothetical protein
LDDVSAKNIDYRASLATFNYQTSVPSTSALNLPGYSGIAYPKLFWINDGFRVIYTGSWWGPVDFNHDNSKMLAEQYINKTPKTHPLDTQRSRRTGYQHIYRT